MEIFLSLIKVKKCSAYRSIPTAFPRRHLFDAVINTGKEQDQLIAWANASSGIDDHENFGEFLFDKVELPKSRFTDGTFPVWYGSEDVKTCLLEIEFHLKIDTQKEVDFGFIDYERAVCLATLEMTKNTDVKFLESSLTDYNKTSSYSACFSEFEKKKKLGVTSLTYASARNTGKECYAVTVKSEISSSIVKNFFRLRVYADSSKATEVAELVLQM